MRSLSEQLYWEVLVAFIIEIACFSSICVHFSEASASFSRDITFLSIRDATFISKCRQFCKNNKQVLTRQLLLESHSKNARLKCGILYFLLVRCGKRELIGLLTNTDNKTDEPILLRHLCLQ